MQKNHTQIDSTQVQYTLRCTHPAYQRAANQFMDWIDKELVDAQRIVSTFPASVEHYRLELPLKVDRSRIEPKDAAYVYRDLEFSLSRDEIVSLLMTNELYSNSWLCVRELLQNALDALRYRTALITRDGAEWHDGRVTLEHEVDAYGFEILRCIDNGVGMDVDVVEGFLTRAGRSYYRSPEFERERATFRKANADFDPCAQFGIGFMSSFMIGDRIVITTRRDYGPSVGRGNPLVVEVNGLGGLLVIRPGNAAQPVGTTVEIHGRQKAAIIDDWDDHVRLIDVVEGYAVATEFPILASCTVPGIEGSTEIPTSIAKPPTALENASVKSIITIEESFADVDPRLNGMIRASFIVDDDNRLVRSFGNLRWASKENYARPRNWRIVDNDQEVDPAMSSSSQIALDGILVAGRPGRSDLEGDPAMYLGERAVPFRFGRSDFVLDVRGSLKPRLTPARTPPESMMRLKGEPSWSRLRRVAVESWAKLWERVATFVPDRLDLETFWFLVAAYDAPIIDMRPSAFWTNISVPIASTAGTISTVPITGLGPLSIVEDGDVRLRCESGAIQLWPDAHGALQDLHAAIVSVCHLDLLEGRPVLRVTHAHVAGQRFRERLKFYPSEGAEFRIPFVDSLSSFVTLASPLRIANSSHSVVAELSRIGDSDSGLSGAHRFLFAFVHWATDEKNVQRFERNEPPNEWTVRIGRMFELADWSDVDLGLRPPYKILRADGSAIEVTQDSITEWGRFRRPQSESPTSRPHQRSRPRRK